MKQTQPTLAELRLNTSTYIGCPASLTRVRSPDTEHYETHTKICTNKYEGPQSSAYPLWPVQVQKYDFKFCLT
jgi:hypothetical protein